MKIAFWSHARGSAGVTANVTCMAALTALRGKGRTAVLENHYSMRSIGDMILEQVQLGHLRECGSYYDHCGIEYVLKRLYAQESGELLLRSALVPLLCSSMFYLPQSRIVNKEVFNYEFHLAYKQLFASLEQLVDYVFIDTETNQNLSTNIILSEADLIVVNLTQETERIVDYFENCGAIHEKAVYLIGRYQPASRWNISRLCDAFQIPSGKIGVIPYNLEMEDAIATGHLTQFLNRNYFKASDRENQQLIFYAKKAEQMIRQNVKRQCRERLVAQAKRNHRNAPSASQSAAMRTAAWL